MESQARWREMLRRAPRGARGLKRQNGDRTNQARLSCPARSAQRESSHPDSELGRLSPNLSYPSVYGGSTCVDACSSRSFPLLSYPGWPLPGNPGCSTTPPTVKWRRLHSTLLDTVAMTCIVDRQRMAHRSILCIWPDYSAFSERVCWPNS